MSPEKDTVWPTPQSTALVHQGHTFPKEIWFRAYTRQHIHICWKSKWQEYILPGSICIWLHLFWWNKRGQRGIWNQNDRTHKILSHGNRIIFSRNQVLMEKKLWQEHQCTLKTPIVCGTTDWNRRPHQCYCATHGNPIYKWEQNQLYTTREYTHVTMG